jgi:hypothetical protein
MRKLWKCKLPLKLKVFMWQTYHDRLQTGVTLKQKKWREDSRCALCGVPETRDHIFFECVMPKFVWTCFKEALGWDRCPRRLQDLLDTWIPLNSTGYDLKNFLLTIVLWAMWTTRNKMAIEGVFLGAPADIMLKISSYLQRWSVLLGASDRSEVGGGTKKVTSWMDNFLKKLETRTSPPGCVSLLFFGLSSFRSFVWTVS